MIRVLCLVLLGLAGYFLYRALGLWTMPVDGDGIGLYLFGVLEITDRLPNEAIPQAAAVFAAVGLACGMMAGWLYRWGRRPSR